MGARAGVLGGAIAGSVVPARTYAEELRHILGFILVFGPAIYVLISRQRARWEAKHPYVRFVVFTLTMVVASVVLIGLVVLVFDGTGAVVRGAGFLAGLGAFAVTAWMTFFGGAERLWREFLDRTDTEW
ncbi:hypothetical protein ACFQL4_07160 [Halosimplex aquaticum]